MEKLKVLLTVPMTRPEEIDLPSAENYPYVNDNGLGYVTASCKDAGAEVTLYSWNNNFTSDGCREKLSSINPDIVGVKVFTAHFERVFNTLKIIRETLRDAVVVIGGPHVSTSKPEDLFIEFEGLIDYAISGDGEEAIRVFINEFREACKKIHQMDLKKIPGLIYREGALIRKNNPSFDINLNDLPPIDWKLQQPVTFPGLMKKGEGEISVYLEDSRGCPAHCSHCASYIISGSKTRKRTLSSLCSDIENLVDVFGVKHIVFTGNGLLSNKDYTVELCNWLIRSKKKISWLCTGAYYVDHLVDKKLVKLMSSAGCKEIWFGIESGNREVRKQYRYDTPLEVYTEIIKNVVSNGISANSSFMFGLPYETRKAMADTIRYAYTLPFTVVSFCICLPFPGTLSNKVVLDKYNISRIDWSKFDFSNPDMLPCHATISDVNRYLLISRFFERSRMARRLAKAVFPYKLN